MIRGLCEEMLSSKRTLSGNTVRYGHALIENQRMKVAPAYSKVLHFEASNPNTSASPNCEPRHTGTLGQAVATVATVARGKVGVRRPHYFGADLEKNMFLVSQEHSSPLKIRTSFFTLQWRTIANHSIQPRRTSRLY